MSPPVCKQDTADIQEHAGNGTLFLHRISSYIGLALPEEYHDANVFVVVAAVGNGIP
jgi:hypothetical protein